MKWNLVILSILFFNIYSYGVVGSNVLNLSYDPVDRPEIQADFALFPHIAMGLFASTKETSERKRDFTGGISSSYETSQVIGLRLQHFAAGAFKTGPYFLGTLASTLLQFEIQDRDPSDSSTQMQQASLGIGYALFYQNVNIQAGANYILPITSEISLKDGITSEYSADAYTFDLAIGWLF